MRGADPKKLSADNQRLFLKIVNEDPHSHSFLIYNSNETKRKVNQWREHLSWISPFYAIKANPIKPLVNDLSQAGFGFDCASKAEIETALKQGTSPQNIVFSNSIKEERDIAYAAKNGVLLTTADTFEELEKIQKISKDMKVLWRLSIKEDSNVTTLFSNKFGDDIKSLKEAEERFTAIKKMGITLEGIHFHCGSGQHGSSTFDKAVQMARACISLGRKYGHRMETLDIGGGFPAGDLNSRLTEALHITKDDPLGYRVIAEPGRYLSGRSCYLTTKILGKRVKNGRTCYHINDSLYHSFNCILMDGISFEKQNDQFYDKWTIEEGKEGSLKYMNFDISQRELSNGSIFGMSCDGMDVICNDISMPEMNVSDWIVMGGLGAYTFGPKSEFNGMKALKKVVNVRLKGEEELDIDKDLPSKKISTLNSN